MPTLRLITEAGKAETTVEASPALVVLSETFLSEARALQLACPEGLAVSMQMQFVAPASTRICVNASAAEQAGMLHRLRPFVLSREAVYVPKYLSAFCRENRNAAACAAANSMRDAFLVRDSGFVLQTQEGLLDFDRQWQNYANAHEYHRDADKLAQLSKTFAASPIMAEFVFWFAGLLKIKTILSMQGLAAILAGKSELFVVNLRDEPNGSQAPG